MKCRRPFFYFDEVHPFLLSPQSIHIAQIDLLNDAMYDAIIKVVKNQAWNSSVRKSRCSLCFLVASCDRSVPISKLGHLHFSDRCRRCIVAPFDCTTQLSSRCQYLRVTTGCFPLHLPDLFLLVNVNVLSSCYANCSNLTVSFGKLHRCSRVIFFFSQNTVFFVWTGCTPSLAASCMATRSDHVAFCPIFLAAQVRC